MGARAGTLLDHPFGLEVKAVWCKAEDYDDKIFPKSCKLARKSALSHKVKANEFLVIEDLIFDSPKTKEFVKILANLKLTEKNIL